MLFKIPDEIITLAENNNKDALGAIGAIAISSYRGDNIMYASSKDYERMSVLNGLSPQCISTIKKKLAHFSEESGVIDHFTTYIEVSNATDIIVEIIGNTKIIKVPIRIFVEENSVTSEPVILCENLNDSSYYKYMCKFYLYHKQILGGFNPKYRPECGGGDTTYSSYKQYAINDLTHCLCIVDSDKKYSNAELGQTAKKVMKVHTDLNPKLCLYYCIELVREIENLIPKTVLAKINTESRDGNMGYNHLCLISDYDTELFLFADFKEGLICRKYKDTIDTYLLPKLKKLLIDLKFKTDSELAQIKIEDKPEGIIIQGMGKNMLERAISVIENISDWKSLNDDLLDAQRKEWLTIGELLFNYTCAFPKVRS